MDELLELRMRTYVLETLVHDLWIIALRDKPDPAASAAMVAELHCSSIEGSYAGPVGVSPEGHAMRQLALHHLESFWERVQKRLGQPPR